MVTSEKRIKLLATASLLFALLLNSRLVASSSTYIHPDAYSFPPSLQLKLSLGYNNLIASLKWIAFVNYFGADDATPRDYIKLADKLESITFLNPLSDNAYLIAAVVLPWEAGNTSLSKPLLEKAMLNLPLDWRWPFYRGFNAYWFDHDLNRASVLLLQAAKLPNAPALAANLAIRMHASAGALDSGLLFLDHLINAQEDRKIRSRLIQQRLTLITEKQLRMVDTALEKLPLRHYDERDLIELQKSGFPLPSKLADGGHIVFKRNGEIVSSVSRNRFKVYVPPKRLNQNAGTQVK